MCPPTPAPLNKELTDLLRNVEDDTEDIVESTDNSSTVESLSVTLGERQERVMVATPDGVTITSTLEPQKSIYFDLNRWAHFVGVLARVDEEV